MALHQIRSDVTLRKLLRGEGDRRVSDGEGLYILPRVNGGSDAWRFDYTFEGKRKTLSLGTYPATTLQAARRSAADARQLVAEGVDPSTRRKQERVARSARKVNDLRHAKGLPAADSFEGVAREWLEIRRTEWAARYFDKITRMLERDVFPWLGQRRIAELAPLEILSCVRRVEARGAIETAHRVLDCIGQVFLLAIPSGLVSSNPARDLKGALKKPVPRHFAAITEPARFGDLLRACDAYAGSFVVRTALRLAPMLLLRPGELRQARWQEFDLKKRLWTVPAARMKRRKAGKLNGPPHLVPLPRQAIAALEELHPLTGAGEYVFRGERHHDRPISDGTVNAALRMLGFASDEVTGHGFRASARTMLQERLGVDPDVIEAQLAHNVKDSLGRAYNRTTFGKQRAAMLQRWADYLDALRNERSSSSGGGVERGAEVQLSRVIRLPNVPEKIARRRQASGGTGGGRP